MSEYMQTQEKGQISKDYFQMNLSSGNFNWNLDFPREPIETGSHQAEQPVVDILADLVPSFQASLADGILEDLNKARAQLINLIKTSSSKEEKAVWVDLLIEMNARIKELRQTIDLVDSK